MRQRTTKLQAIGLLAGVILLGIGLTGLVVWMLLHGFGGLVNR